MIFCSRVLSLSLDLSLFFLDMLFRAADLESPDAYPKKAFIVEAIDKEIRLSFANRVRGTLPEAYDYLIPSDKEKDLPDFKYEIEGMNFHLRKNPQEIFAKANCLLRRNPR